MHTTFTDLYSYPIYSIIIAMILMIGIYQSSIIFVKKITFYQNHKLNMLILSLFNISILLMILQPVFLFSFYISYFLIFFLSFLILFFIIFIYNNLSFFKNLIFSKFFFYKTSLEYLFYFLLFLYFLISLFPITDPDSLDYHIGIPLNIINNGQWPVLNEWFHSRLSGTGEILITLGINFNSPHFASILQFFSIFIICSILKFIFNVHLEKQNLIYVIAFLVSPVLLLLTNSIKPLLLPMAMTVTSFFLLVNIIYNNIYSRFIYLIIITLCFTATLIKFNFFLPAGLISVSTFLYLIFFKKDYFFLFSSSFLIFILIYSPSLIFDYFAYNALPLDSLLTIFPGNIPAYDQFIVALKVYKDSLTIFPLSLLLPSSFGSVTSSIGVFSIFFIFLLNKFDNKIIRFIFIFSFVIFILNYYMGQKAGRFYLEWSIYIIIAFSFISSQISNFNRKLLKYLILTQSFFTILILLIAIYFFTPHIFTKNGNLHIFNKYAYGFDIKIWAESYINNETILLSDHRSIAIFDNKTISTDWKNFAKTKDDILFYLDLLKQHKINTYLIKGDKIYNKPFFKCLGKKISGPHQELVKSRNPFNSGLGANYRLYEFKYELLPNCYNINNEITDITLFEK